MTADIAREAAYHTAGHLVMAWRYGVLPETIEREVPGSEELGVCPGWPGLPRLPELETMTTPTSSVRSPGCCWQAGRPRNGSRVIWPRHPARVPTLRPVGVPGR